MLKSTLLFVGLMTDLSSQYDDLSSKDLITVAATVAEEAEFVGNTEITEIIQLMGTNKPLNHLKKIAYDCNLKEEV